MQSGARNRRSLEEGYQRASAKRTSGEHHPLTLTPIPHIAKQWLHVLRWVYTGSCSRYLQAMQCNLMYRLALSS